MVKSGGEIAAQAQAPAEPRHRRNLPRLASTAAGLTVLALALTVAGSLVSYHAEDPSRLVQSEEPARNWLGVQGAWFAAEAYAWIGTLSAWMVTVTMFIWGGLLLARTPIRRLWLRILFLALALVGVAHAQALFLPASESAFTGISLASLALIRESLDLDLSGDPTTKYAMVAGFVLFAFLTWFYAAAVPLSTWRAGWKLALRPLGFLGNLGGLKNLGGLGNLRSLGSLFRRDRNEKNERTEPVLEHDPFLRRTRRTKSKAKSPAKRTKEVLMPTPPRVGKREAEERQKDFGLVLEGTRLPPLDLLKKPSRIAPESDEGREANARMLESVLNEFRVSGEVGRAVSGPVVTRYEFEPAAGTRSNRVIALSGDIARSMSATTARVAIIPGRNAIGIELPNARRETVYLRELLGSEQFEGSTASLPLALGKDIAGVPVIVDLARMPHLLIAGTTGSGKSVGVNTMVLSLLYRTTPEQVRFIMIDPKMLELSVYEGIPHLLHPVVTDPKKAVAALRWAIREMNDRYQKMSLLGVRGIGTYNRKVEESIKKKSRLSRTVQVGFDPETGKPAYEEQEIEAKPFPYVVIVVDEMADLMLSAGKEFELAVQALAQKARAAGIHMIVATQRPSVDVVTGTIKANLPCRISFQVSSAIDSRTVLGDQGAEQLLGKGDMLFMQTGGQITRAHGPFVGDDEVEKVSDFLREQGEPEYVEEITQETEDMIGVETGDDGRDPLFTDAVSIIMREGKASTSFLQRHLQVGYNRAARIIEKMETDGIVSAANHAGKREVLMPGDNK